MGIPGIIGMAAIGAPEPGPVWEPIPPCGPTPDGVCGIGGIGIGGIGGICACGRGMGGVLAGMDMVCGPMPGGIAGIDDMAAPP